jgi:hypothetical protein
MDANNVLQKLHHARSEDKGDVGLDGRDGTLFLRTTTNVGGPKPRARLGLADTTSVFKRTPVQRSVDKDFVVYRKKSNKSVDPDIAACRGPQVVAVPHEEARAAHLQRERAARDAEAAQQAQQHTGTRDAPKKRSVDEPPVVELAKRKSQEPQSAE